MRVVKTILCDLTGYTVNTVDVAQGDRLSRAVECRLMANFRPWQVPEGAQASIAYELPDGTPGLYATMPDGSPAAVIDGNAVTVILSDRITEQAGVVRVSVVLTDDAGAQLATFPFRVHIHGGRKLNRPEQYPALGAEFEGQLLYGGADGAVTPLKVGAGLMLDDGTLTATGGGGGGSTIVDDGSGNISVAAGVTDDGDGNITFA